MKLGNEFFVSFGVSLDTHFAQVEKLLRLCRGQLAQGLWEGKVEGSILCSETHFRQAMHAPEFREALTNEECIAVYYEHPRAKFMMMGLRPVPMFTYAFTKFSPNEDNDALLYHEPMSWRDAQKRFKGKGCMYLKGVAYTAYNLRMTGEKETPPALPFEPLVIGHPDAVQHYGAMALAAHMANLQRMRMAGSVPKSEPGAPFGPPQPPICQCRVCVEKRAARTTLVK